ncbi:protoporphyrinogen oxidase [Amycolatopsis sp. CA-230715]|uniref:protoporphyrinogen oxidase n=1 Tax=Amycolatopsis sp. CA-230715 TaxID=2745196 RepID=UPI001C039455|nr:protoporphyrinogen oxidase [Amycolatopsis sp. CA-230715]QWF76880.1 Protoporphyrinogen oxidase [Amycolatopsis sp. CA-230715]
MTGIAVVGGGISGLTAAYRLRAELGDRAEITVVESSPWLGGKLRTIDLAGRAYDVGAEAFLARRPEAMDLVAEIGLGDRLTHPTGARATVLAGGHATGLPAGTVMGVPSSPEAVKGVLSPEAVALVAAEAGLPPVELGEHDTDLGALLRRRFGDELVDRLVDPLLGGVYAGGADGLGLRATMPGLAKAIDGGARSLTEAAASITPPSPSGAPVFGTLKGGLGTVITRLAELSRARIRLGVPARALRRTATGWRLELGAAAQAHAPEQSVLDVDAVVLAVPAPAARRLLADAVPAAAEAFAGIELASMAVVAMAFPRGTELPESSGLLIGAGERAPSGTPLTAKAFTFSARKWGHYGENDGPVLLRGSVGRFGETASLQAGDDELADLVRRDLAETTGLTTTPIEVAVTRWGGGLPQYSVGHFERVARIERAVAEAGGLAVTGAALHGVGIPACIATATAAATTVTAGMPTE